MTKVVLFAQKSPQQKLDVIARLCVKTLSEKCPLIIFVNDRKSGEFLDEYLWKFQRESFLPHALVQGHTKDLIVITEIKKNLNKADRAINLTPSPIMHAPYAKIYEFDRGDPDSKKSYETYKGAGYPIQLISG